MKINLKYLILPVLVPLSLSAGDLDGYETDNEGASKYKGTYVRANNIGDNEKLEIAQKIPKFTSESARAFLASDTTNVPSDLNVPGALKYLLDNGNEEDHDFAVKYISKEKSKELENTKRYNDKTRSHL